MNKTAQKIFVALASTFFAQAAMAQEAAAAHTGGSMDRGLIAIGAGIAIGVAALGGGLGQGKTASAALEGIARNPGASDKIFTPMIVSLAFIESLVIYALVIAIMLKGNM